MKKLLQMSIIFIVIIFTIIIVGYTQQLPTGEIIANETFEPVKCTSDWNCTFWSDCIRTDAETGIQNRTCIDNNNCNAEKPQESRPCGLSKITIKEPSQMALQISDFPADKEWIIKKSSTRSREDVSQIEKALGFKKGYNITYSSKEDSKTNHIDQFISVYPLVNSAINMSFSFDAAKENYREKTFFENQTNKIILSVAELPSPNIGDLSIAYNITILYSTTGLRESIYTICFTKWDVAEVIRVSGTESDYDSLKNLAETAEERIG